MDFPGGSDGKESACNSGDLVSVPGSGRSLEKGMATYSSILAWRIPEPHSMGLQKLGHDWSDFVGKQAKHKMQVPKL